MVSPRELPNYVGGLKRTAIDELVKKGEFPAPVRLSERRKTWLEQELIDWQQARLTERAREIERKERKRGAA